MSQTLTFVPDAKEGAKFEVEIGGGQHARMLFELSGLVRLEYPNIYPPFVKAFLNMGDPTEPNVEEMSGWDPEEIFEGFNTYIGPSFLPDELIRWALTWSAIIDNLNEMQRKNLGFMTELGFDWTPFMLEDLREMVGQARRAQQKGVTLHVEWV